MPDRVHATNSSPTPPAPVTDGLTGRHFGPGTNVPHRFLEGLQESNVRPIEDAGETPDINDYDQTANLLSGVHAILSEIRSTLAAAKNTTVAKMALIASRLSSVGGDRCAVIASDNCDIDSASTHESACLAAKKCILSGYRTAAVASEGCTVDSVDSAVVGCFDVTAPPGAEGAVGVGSSESKVLSKVSAILIAAYKACQGATLAVLFGRYCENVDDDCLAGGYGTSLPTGWGDGLTNKNLFWKIFHRTGKFEAAGSFGGFANAPLPLTKRVLSTTVNWNTADADHDVASPVVDYTDSSVVEVTLTIDNGDIASHDFEMGSSILMAIDGITATGGTLVGAFAHTIAGSTAAQKGLRWSCGIMIDAADSNKIKVAITSAGKTTVSLAGNNAESITVKVYLQYAALKAVA